MTRTGFLRERLLRKSLIIGAAFVAIGMYLYRLGSLPGTGLSLAEQNLAAASRSLDALLSSPFFLPLSGLRYVCLKVLPGHETLAVRLPSALIGILTVTAMLYIIRRWYGKRTLLFGIVLVLCSAWFLHIGRSATNDIAYLAATPMLLASSLLLYEYPERKFFLFLWVALLTLCLYVPGLVWFVLATLLLQRNTVADALSHTAWLSRFGLVVLTTILLVPFVYVAARHANLDLGLTWLGLPSELPTWRQPLKDGVAAILFVFVRTPANPSLWLGRLPLLDALMTTSFIAGIFFYVRHIGAERTHLLLTYSLVGLLLCMTGIEMARSLIVPLVYLIAIGGAAYILYEWLTLFPKNPLARRLGIGLIFVAVGLSGLYGLRQYYVAWPHNPQTIKAFAQSNRAT